MILILILVLAIFVICLSHLRLQLSQWGLWWFPTCTTEQVSQYQEYDKAREKACQAVSNDITFSGDFLNGDFRGFRHVS